MYKKTAKSRARKLLKDHQYLPSLNTLSDKGGGGIWSKKKKKPNDNKEVSKKEQKRLTDTEKTDTIFGMRFRD